MAGGRSRGALRRLVAAPITLAALAGAAPRTASLFLLKCPARSRWPDGSNTTNPLSGCRGGGADHSSSVNFAGISRRGPVLPSSS